MSVFVKNGKEYNVNANEKREMHCYTNVIIQNSKECTVNSNPGFELESGG